MSVQSVDEARKQEIASKLQRLRERLIAHRLDGVKLNLIPNTAWITAGARTYVGEGTDVAASSILVTLERAYILTDGVEAPRLRQEEGLEELGFELIVEPWYASGKFAASFGAKYRMGEDVPGHHVNMGEELRHLRSVLHPNEVARLRRVCRTTAEIMGEVVRSLRPGMTEHQVAARLAAASRERGGTAVVNLVASDERVYQYRHPLPTNKTIERYVMAVLCFRYEGLIPAITRLVHFGPLPEDLRMKAHAVAQVDARLILGTQAGKTLGDMFNIAKQAYQDVGYPEAIAEHHQGGSLAYMPREVLASEGNPTVIEEHQAFAWNPSIRGVKSEDTILLTHTGPEVLTEVVAWPTWSVNAGGQSIERPAILEV
jgi:Xaa-Pro aminopeptidase